MGNYTYDAFISYRHIPHDKKIAENLQKLLENYKPPKNLNCSHGNGIKRIFRDESELPTSGDLDKDIKKALEESSHLILVCSEETSKSPWCIREIDYFKSLHGGKTDKILTLLVSGDPREVFPKELCYETKEITLDNGETALKTVELEPLAANVVSSNTKGSLKKLRTEFLRLAAPILGCSYDDLFRRHQKRFIRRLLVSAFVLMAMITSFSVYAIANANIIKSQAKSLLINQSLSLAYYSNEERIKNNYILAILLAKQALPKNPSSPERPLVKEAEKALRSAVFDYELSLKKDFVFQKNKLEFQNKDVEVLGVSPDGSRVAVTDFTDNFVYDTITGKLIASYKGSVSFNHDITLALQWAENTNWQQNIEEFYLYDIGKNELKFKAEYPINVLMANGEKSGSITPKFYGNSDFIELSYSETIWGNDNIADGYKQIYLNFYNNEGKKYSGEEGLALCKTAEDSEPDDVDTLYSKNNKYSISMKNESVLELRLKDTDKIVYTHTISGDDSNLWFSLQEDVLFTDDGKYLIFNDSLHLFIISLENYKTCYTYDIQTGSSAKILETALFDNDRFLFIDIMDEQDDVTRIIDLSSMKDLIEINGEYKLCENGNTFLIHQSNIVYVYEMNNSTKKTSIDNKSIDSMIKLNNNQEKALDKDVINGIFSPNSNLFAYKEYTNQITDSNDIFVGEFLKDNKFRIINEIKPSNPHSIFNFDSTGTLIINNFIGGGGEIYDAKTSDLLLQYQSENITVCNGMIYIINTGLIEVPGRYIGGYEFKTTEDSYKWYSTKELLIRADELLTHDGVTRKLTEDELRKYFISEH